MNQITLTLPVETVNAALAALAKAPYEFAQPHIDLIRDRASAAMKEAEAKAQESESLTAPQAA